MAFTCGVRAVTDTGLVHCGIWNFPLKTLLISVLREVHAVFPAVPLTRAYVGFYLVVSSFGLRNYYFVWLLILLRYRSVYGFVNDDWARIESHGDLLSYVHNVPLWWRPPPIISSAVIVVFSCVLLSFKRNDCPGADCDH